MTPEKSVEALLPPTVRIGPVAAGSASDVRVTRRHLLEGAGAIVHVPRALYLWNSPLTQREKVQRAAAAQTALRKLDPAAALEILPANEPLFQPRRIMRPLSRAERNTSVSLIIPTRDRVDLLERCIASVRKHTRWTTLEIIVVGVQAYVFTLLSAVFIGMAIHAHH